MNKIAWILASLALAAPAAAQTPPSGVQSGVAPSVTPAQPQASQPSLLPQASPGSPQMIPPQVPQTLAPGETGAGQVPNGIPGTAGSQAGGSAASNQK